MEALPFAWRQSYPHNIKNYRVSNLLLSIRTEGKWFCFPAEIILSSNWIKVAVETREKRNMKKSIRKKKKLKSGHFDLSNNNPRCSMQKNSNFLLKISWI